MKIKRPETFREWCHQFRMMLGVWIMLMAFRVMPETDPLALRIAAGINEAFEEFGA